MAEQTLLQMCQDVSRLLNLEVPSAVIASTTDGTLQQLLALANREVMEHCNREFQFPKLKVDTTFNFTTDTNHIAVNLSTSSAFDGMRSVVPETLWDSTAKLMVMGPVSDQRWQQILVFGSAMANPQYRVAGNNLLIFPNNAAQHVYVCTYISKFGVQATSAGARKETFTVDTDVPILPSRIVKAGMVWRYRQMKGQPYAEEKESYELFLAEEANQESIPGPLSMDDSFQGLQPGVWVPAGSWTP